MSAYGLMNKAECQHVFINIQDFIIKVYFRSALKFKGMLHKDFLIQLNSYKSIKAVRLLG